MSAGKVIKRAQLDAVGSAKLGEIDSRIRELKRVQRGLKKLLAQPFIDPTQPCPVLTALD